MKDSGKTRVGVIGVGYLGNFHARRWKEVADAELVGVSDADFARAEEVAREVGCRAFADNRALLEAVDAVSIVVPTRDHYAVARSALELGRDILVEKPVTHTLEEADELLKLAAARQRIFMVGHLERFNPAVLALAEALTRPAFIEVHRLGPFLQRASNIDVVRDLMIHDLDIVLSLVGSEVERLSAMGIMVLSDKIDIANARIEFKNGTVANLTASRVSLGAPVRKIRIFQTDNYISLDYSKKELAVFTLGPGQEDDPMSRIKIRQTPIDDEDALRTELKAFARSVQTREQPAVTGEDGRRALHAAMLVHEEIRKSLKKFFRT